MEPGARHGSPFITGACVAVQGRPPEGIEPAQRVVLELPIAILKRIGGPVHSIAFPRGVGRQNQSARPVRRQVIGKRCGPIVRRPQCLPSRSVDIKVSDADCGDLLHLSSFRGGEGRENRTSS